MRGTEMDGMLGKLPRKLDKRTLWLENYLDFPSLPPLPERVDYLSKAAPFSMAGNDVYGDCVVASASHMIPVWTATAGRHTETVPDQKVVDTYLKLTGGVDSGLYLLDFLRFWKSTGFYGHKIGAFAAVNPKNIKAVKYANFLFGGVYLGLGLPLSAKDNDVWEVPAVGLTGNGAPYSWGGHAVNCGEYGNYYNSVVTWGRVQPMSWEFLAAYCDEAYAIVTLEWFTTAHKTPQGVGWKDLVSDLGKISKLP